MYCEKCGTEVQNNVAFCQNCGNKLNNTVLDTQYSGEEASTKISTANMFANKVFKNKKLLIVLGVIFVLLIGIIITFAIVSGKDTSKDNNNISEDYSTLTQIPGNNETMAYITYASDISISGGMAEAKLETEDGKSYEAIIDIDGNIRYLCDESEYVFYAPESEDDIGCICSENSHKYKLINAKGEIIKESEENESNYVLACGNGNALIYKCEADIDSESHLFGVINSSGEWSVPLKDYGQKLQQISKAAIYAGENVFDIGIDVESNKDIYHTNEHMFLNASTGKAFWVYYDPLAYEDRNAYEDISIPFEDGVNYFVNNGQGSCAYVGDTPLITNDGETDWKKVEESYNTYPAFALYPNGTWKALPDDFPALNGYREAGNKWTKTDGKYLTIYDYDTKTESEFTAYESSMIQGLYTSEDYCFIGNYALILINGKDGEHYFTLIDSKGKMQFEPILGSMPRYLSDKIVFNTDSDTISIVDNTGKILCENIEGSSCCGCYGDLIQVYTKDERVKIINSEGATIIDRIKLPDNLN